MAAIEYSDLSGNESILKAVEYLRMLPEWKAKPAKLRSGYVEFGEVIARHLVNLYCNLEGKPLLEKIDLDELTNPLLQEKEFERAHLDDIAVNQAYAKRLDAWHIELSIVQKGIQLVLDEMPDEDERLGAVSHVMQRRFLELIESCPWPGGGFATTP